MLKNKQIFTKFFVIQILLLLIMSTNNVAIAKNNIPVSQKIWQGLASSDIDLFKKVINYLNNKKYQEALDAIKQDEQNEKPQQGSAIVNLEGSDSYPVKNRPNLKESMKEIILWKKYSDKSQINNINFNDISRFVGQSEFYPNIEEIKRNVEKVALVNDISYKKSEKYFKLNPAGTKESKMFILQSEINFLKKFKGGEEEKTRLYNEVRAMIADIWVKDNFNKEEEKEFLEKYKEHLIKSDYINRIDRLIWSDKFDDARRIINFVDEDYQLLFLSIIKIANGGKFIDNIIASVPRKLRSNEGLLYRQALWHKANDNPEKAIEIIIDLKDKLQFPDKWWSVRKFYSREMLKKKNYKLAYSLMARHSLAYNSSDFWDAEWSAGWIALRFLDSPSKAYQHFDNLYKHVSQPVTLARASYWLGMSAQAKGDNKTAIEWYKVAAKYPIFFYGQLAIHKHRTIDKEGAKNDIILPEDPQIYLSDMKNISQSKATQVAYLLALMGDKANSAKIFEWVVNNLKTDGQVAVIIKIINELGDRPLDAKIARVAAKKNVFFIKDKFQIVQEVLKDDHAPLIHAIIKQESAFLPSAVSQVGAIGFMQLMPETAKLVAKEMNIPFDKKKLATDISYNIKLGSFYIKKLIDRFEGSEILAIASYNAGPNATQRWINEFYDPRSQNDIDKVVDWIELITYSETRNYVQRIMENLIVYKYLMAKSNYDKIN